MWVWKHWPFKRKSRVPQVSYDTLHVVNRLRAQHRYPPLDRFTAQTAVAGSYESPSFDMVGFLVGYETGIPVTLSTGSIMGAAMHSSSAREVEPLVPRYTDEERRRSAESFTPTSNPYIPSPSSEIHYKPSRESFYDSSPSYSSNDDNRSSYSSSDYGSSSSYDSSSSSSSSDSSSSSSSSE